MAATVSSNSDQLKLFRQKAEALLKSKLKNNVAYFDTMEVSELLHELQVFQIELEMQNDELTVSHEYLEFERGKFAALYDLAPLGYFILNKFGTIEDVNLIGAKMLSSEKSALIKRRFQDFIQHGEIMSFYGFLNKLAVPNVRYSCQLKIAATDDKLIHAQVEGISITNNVTGHTQFYIAVIDVTESRNAEQRLHETNERLKMTLEASATGTWEIDLDKKHIFLDDYSYTIYGYQPWEFDGKFETFFRRVHPEDLERVKQVFKDVNRQKELDLEYRAIKGTNEIKYLQVRGHVVNTVTDDLRIVGIVIDITEKKRLELEAEALRVEHQKNILAATLQGQEKERKRISESLHDSVSQLLYAIRLNLQSHDKAILKTEPFSNINQLLDQAIKETRNISFELAPSILNDFGLKEGLKEMAKRLSAANFTVKIKVSDLKQRLDPELEISAFRIVQELLNNSIKHGHATETQVKIDNTVDSINITVSDNGKGFNAKDTDYLLKGSGLRSIKNRVNLFNGWMDVKSTAGKGTTVNITLKNNEH